MHSGGPFMRAQGPLHVLSIALYVLGPIYALRGPPVVRSVRPFMCSGPSMRSGAPASALEALSCDRGPPCAQEALSCTQGHLHALRGPLSCAQGPLHALRGSLKRSGPLHALRGPFVRSGLSTSFFRQLWKKVKGGPRKIKWRNPAKNRGRWSPTHMGPPHWNSLSLRYFLDPPLGQVMVVSVRF